MDRRGRRRAGIGPVQLCGKFHQIGFLDQRIDRGLPGYADGLQIDPWRTAPGASRRGNACIAQRHQHRYREPAANPFAWAASTLHILRQRVSTARASGHLRRSLNPAKRGLDARNWRVASISASTITRFLKRVVLIPLASRKPPIEVPDRLVVPSGGAISVVIRLLGRSKFVDRLKKFVDPRSSEFQS